MRRLRLWSIVTAFLIVSGAPALAGETPTPSSAAPSGSAPPKAVATAPDLKIVVKVADRGYVVDEEVPIDVTITNSGDADAKAVKATGEQKAGSPFHLDTAGFGKFATAGGDTVPAGKNTDLHLKGNATDWQGGDTQLTFRVSSPDDLTTEGAVQEITVKITPTTKKAKVGGVFYGDANDNGTFDAGEGLADAGVKLTPISSATAFAQLKTDANGRFEFTGVPARVYRLDPDAGLPNDWISPLARTIVADGTETADLRAAKPLSGVLKASVRFKEGPYKPGDDAHLTITLANTGSKAVEHVVADCDQAGSGWHLSGYKNSAQWGELATPGGVTVDVGETRVFQVSGKLPEDSINSGVVYISCRFGPAGGQYAEGFPRVFTLAKVPGKNGTFTATFYQDKNGDNTVGPGEAVPNLDVILHDPLDGAQAAKATTDAEGFVKFGNIPACWYIPELSAGWKLKDNGFIPVNAKDTEHWAVQVVPKPDTDNPNVDAPVAARQVAGTDALANTGADVTAPAITGLALLVLGVGAVLFTRRRASR
jgi:LPXTG-motif cell wall-anchored protein